MEKKPTLTELRPPRFYIPNKFVENANAFFTLYEMEDYIPFPPAIQVELSIKPKKERTCRFCNKSYPIVSFKSKAHRIPELLGSHNIISDFECDQCNSLLGRYESDLANFLGIARTMQGVKGKNSIPKYKSVNSSLIIDSSSSNEITISRNNVKDNSISYNSDDCSYVFTFTCNPYIPLHVYKALLKIALSVLPEKYVSFYRQAFEYAISDNTNTDLSGTKLVGYIHPYFVLIFSKFHFSNHHSVI